MKVLVLSDLHLGHDGSRAGRQLEQISVLARQYDRVILNGDTLDRYEKPDCQPQAPHLLRQVNEACRCHSGPPELLAGNHDPVISRTHWVYLAPSATLIFHGDCIADCTHPSKQNDQLLRVALAEQWQQIGQRPARFLELAQVYRDVQARHLRDNPLLHEPRNTWRYLWTSVCPPQRIWHVLRYWQLAPRRVAHLAATFDRPVRHVIFGHSHLPGRWRIGNLTVYNTGSFMPLSKPYAALVEGERVTLRSLSGLLASTRTVFGPLTPTVDESVG